MGDVTGFKINLIILLNCGQSRNRAEEHQTLVRCSNPALELKIITIRYTYTHNKRIKRETNIGTWHIYVCMCMYVYISSLYITLGIHHSWITTSQTYNTGLIHL